MRLIQRKKLFWKGTLAVYSCTTEVDRLRKFWSRETFTLKHTTNKSSTHGTYQKSPISKQDMFGTSPLNSTISSKCHRWGEDTKHGCWIHAKVYHSPQAFKVCKEFIHCGCKKPAEACVTSKSNMSCTTFYFCMWRCMSPIAVITYMLFCLCMTDNTYEFHPGLFCF